MSGRCQAGVRQVSGRCHQQAKGAFLSIQYSGNCDFFLLKCTKARLVPFLLAHQLIITIIIIIIIIIIAIIIIIIIASALLSSSFIESYL